MQSVDAAMSFSSVQIEKINIVVNADLACLEKWFESNTFSLNIVETNAMILGSAQKLGQMNKTPDITPGFQVNGNVTDVVHEKVERGNEAKLLHKKMPQVLGHLKNMSNDLFTKAPLGTCA